MNAFTRKYMAIMFACFLFTSNPLWGCEPPPPPFQPATEKYINHLQFLANLSQNQSQWSKIVNNPQFTFNPTSTNSNIFNPSILNNPEFNNAVNASASSSAQNALTMPRQFPGHGAWLENQYSWANQIHQWWSFVDEQQRKQLNAMLNYLPRTITREKVTKNKGSEYTFTVKRVFEELPLLETLVSGFKGVSNYEGHLMTYNDAPNKAAPDSIQILRAKDGSFIVDVQELEDRGYELDAQMVIASVPGYMLTKLQWDAIHALLEAGYGKVAITGLFRGDAFQSLGENSGLQGGANFLLGGKEKTALDVLGTGQKGSGLNTMMMNYIIHVSAVSGTEKPIIEKEEVKPEPKPEFEYFGSVHFAFDKSDYRPILKEEGLVFNNEQVLRAAAKRMDEKKAEYVSGKRKLALPSNASEPGPKGMFNKKRGWDMNSVYNYPLTTDRGVEIRKYLASLLMQLGWDSNLAYESIYVQPQGNLYKLSNMANVWSQRVDLVEVIAFNPITVNK